MIGIFKNKKGDVRMLIVFAIVSFVGLIILFERIVVEFESRLCAILTMLTWIMFWFIFTDSISRLL